MNQYSLLLPEIVLFVLSCFFLFLKNKNELGLIAISTTLLVTLFNYSGGSSEILNEMVYISPFTQCVKIVILAFSCIFFVQVIAVRQSHSKYFSVLVLFSILGMLLSVSSSALPSLYLALELQSICLYGLSCIKHGSARSAEAGVKYVLLGTLMSAIMIYGMSLIFMTSGNLSLRSLFLVTGKMHSVGVLFFMAGLMFKIAAAPFHVWVGDVYEGSPTLSTTFFAILPKISLIVVLISIVSRLEIDAPTDPVQFFSLVENSQYLRNILFISGILSLLFGTLLAFGQNNIKRFIGFASVTHVGYALLGVSTSASLSFGNPGLVYTLVYTFTNFGILSVILMLKEKNITSLKKLRSVNKLAAVGFVILVFSLAGIPPFAGFCAKAYIIKALVETNHVQVALVAMLVGLISAFYYLRIIKESFFVTDYKSDTHIRSNKMLTSIVTICALFSTFGFVLLIY